MTLYEYKLEHLGKILWRQPTIKDCSWTENYRSQYYIGNEKPKIISLASEADLFADFFDLDDSYCTTKNIQYLTPSPEKPLWIINYISNFRKGDGTYQKIVLLELENLECRYKKFPTVGTNYMKCLITVPHNGKTYIEWVMKKWITLLPETNSVKDLKLKLLKEFKKEKKLK